MDTEHIDPWISTVGVHGSHTCEFALLVSACVDPFAQSLALYGTSGFASALSLSDLYCCILILSDSSELSVLCGSHILQEHAQFSGVHSAHHVLPSSRERQQFATLAGPIVAVYSHV